MNHELYVKVAKELGLTTKQVREVFTSVFKMVGIAIKEGKNINLIKLGKFYLNERRKKWLEKSSKDTSTN